MTEQLPIESAPNPHNEALPARQARPDGPRHPPPGACRSTRSSSTPSTRRTAGGAMTASRRRRVTEPRFAIAVGRFYADLAERLVAGAQEVLVAAAGAAADVFEVPGAFELPLAAKYAAESGRYAGVVCLGAVIRGETTTTTTSATRPRAGSWRCQLRTGRAVRLRRAHRGEHGPGARPHGRGQAPPGSGRGRGRAAHGGATRRAGVVQASAGTCGCLY